MWKIFIAYHDSYDLEGSLNRAKEIYNFLKKQHGVACYFFPETGNGFFGNTTVDATHSDLFLLVANKNICKRIDGNGELLDGDPIYDEMSAFYQSKMYGVKNSKGLLRVYCYDHYTVNQADRIYPVASKNVEHFDENRDGKSESFSKILKWVTKAQGDSASSLQSPTNYTRNDPILTQEKLNSKLSTFIESKNKLEKIAKEPLNDSQKQQFVSIFSRITDMQNILNSITINKGNSAFCESQYEVFFNMIELFKNEVNYLELDILNNSPKSLTCVITPQVICTPNNTFFIQTFLGAISYVTKACLEYNGKQYVIALMPPMNVPTVFVVCNNLLVADTDMSTVNYLIFYCRTKGLLI